MKKRIISCVLILVMTLGFLPTVTFADTATSGTCGDNLNWSFDEATGTLTIDGTGDMYDYDYYDRPWYSFKDEISNVIIKNDVTSIGEYAFINCSNIISVTISEKVKAIDLDAFWGCFNIKSVYITNIDSWINMEFYGESSTPLVNGADLYVKNNKLTNLTIPNDITTIGEYSFYGCESITSVTIPDSITKIENGAFGMCSSIDSVFISDINSWIDIEFYGESSSPLRNGAKLYVDNILVTQLIIPNGVTTIGKYVFSGCGSFTTITIPNTVKSIDESAFSGCTSLTSIAIPDSVTSIGESAFFACSSLVSVTIPDSVISIGGSAFYGCESLTSIVLPNSVTSLGGGIFNECSSLISVIIPNSIASIGGVTFYNCKNLTTITISKNVTSVGALAFVGCSNLTTVNYCGSETDRANIKIDEFGNEPLLNATWVYNYGAHTHSYTNACDITCDCGYVRTTTHSFSGYVYNGDASEKADGTKTRVCSVCGHKETVTATGTKWKSSFTDIKTKDFYYKPTLWAVANGITTGTSKTTFSPEEPCTRGQVVTFLWRAAGSPEPKSNTMPFTDVGSKAFYRKAVLWAVEQGITSGTSATTFSPNETCTRGQIATFLWRAKGKPAPKSSNMPFVDVKLKDFYYKAVQWAVENKITSGTTKTTFAPSEPCTRGQIVTFLYRAYN